MGPKKRLFASGGFLSYRKVHCCLFDSGCLPFAAFKELAIRFEQHMAIEAVNSFGIPRARLEPAVIAARPRVAA